MVVCEQRHPSSDRQEVQSLTADFQTPYWPLGGKVSSKNSGARPRVPSHEITYSDLNGLEALLWQCRQIQIITSVRLILKDRSIFFYVEATSLLLRYAPSQNMTTPTIEVWLVALYVCVDTCARTVRD